MNKIQNSTSTFPLDNNTKKKKFKQEFSKFSNPRQIGLFFRSAEKGNLQSIEMLLNSLGSSEMARGRG